MGNAPSSQSQSSRSIRSRISGKERDLRDGPSIGRLSHVVSFYETPPGSLKAGRHTPGPETPAADVTEAKPEPAAKQDPDWDRLAKQLKWKPGVYTIVNAQSGTVVDLSGADNKSVIGFPQHNGKNQQVSSSLTDFACGRMMCTDQHLARSSGDLPRQEVVTLYKVSHLGSTCHWTV